MTLDEVLQLDARDPLADRRSEFVLPDNMIYLDGNSLGCLPVLARERAVEVVERQWGQDLIGSWNKHGWIDLPARVGEKIAALVGAAPGQTLCCDSISVNLFKLLSAALDLQPGRTVILSQRDNFPTDLYMAEGLAGLLGPQRARLVLTDEQQLESGLDEDVAVLMLTQVNFRTGRLHDMRRLTRLAHEKGVLVLWDLAHSAGVLPIALDDCEVDFAVGCGYKYLNGGPGAPAFLYVAARHQQAIRQPLSGWMGHQSPFGFEGDYRPADGIGRFLVGTPPVLSMSVLDAALDVFRGIRLQQLRDKSLALARLFTELAATRPVMEQLRPLFPREEAERGAQLAYAHPQAQAICQALIARGVIADFRAPDCLRLGFSPLFLRYRDVWQSVQILEDILLSGEWKTGKFSQIGKVT